MTYPIIDSLFSYKYWKILSIIKKISNFELQQKNNKFYMITFARVIKAFDALTVLYGEM